MGEYDADLRIFPDEFVPNVQASKTYQRWAKSSPGDRGRWEAFRDALLAGQEPSVPSMSTTFGRALVAAGKEHMSISHLSGTVTNPYPPPPPGGTPVSHFTGTHYPGTTWADTSNYATIASIPLGFIKIVVNPSASNPAIGAVLDAAEAVNLKVVVGLYGFDGVPGDPYALSGSYTAHTPTFHPAIDPATDRRHVGVWTFSANTIRVLTYLQTRRNIIFAFFGFNEPMWEGMGGEYDVCGALSAKNLRDFRTEVRNYMPGVPVWHDLGWFSEWAPPSAANPTPGIHNAYWLPNHPGITSPYADVAGMCDYMSSYDYPFKHNQTYASYKATGLAIAKREVDFAYEKGLGAAFLMQAFGITPPDAQNVRFPTDGEMHDWNHAIRTQFQNRPELVLSWYSWFPAAGHYTEWLQKYPSAYTSANAFGHPLVIA